MPNPSILRFGAFLVTITWMVFLFYLGLIPDLPEAPVIEGSIVTSLGHYGAHLVLASLVFVLASPWRYHFGRSLLAVVGALFVSTILGLIVEAAQSVTEERSAEWSDVLYNFLGALTGSVGLLILSLLKVNYSHMALAVSSSSTALMITGVIVLLVR